MAARSGLNWTDGRTDTNLGVYPPTVAAARATRTSLEQIDQQHMHSAVCSANTLLTHF
jgi:hypothetical protein